MLQKMLAGREFHTDPIPAYGCRNQWETILPYWQKENIKFCMLPDLPGTIRSVKEPGTVIVTSGASGDHAVRLYNNHIEIYQPHSGKIEGYINLYDFPLNVYRWYSQSMNWTFAQLTQPLFIGMYDWEKYIEFAIQFHRAVPRERLCYANFGINSEYRSNVAALVRHMDYITNDLDIPNKEGGATEADQWNYMRQLTEHHYTIVPNGYALCSFRFYEALLLKCIPIVERSVHYEYFKDWPVLIVNSFAEVTKSLLEERLPELQNRIDDFYHKTTRHYMIETVLRSSIEWKGETNG